MNPEATTHPAAGAANLSPSSALWSRRTPGSEAALFASALLGITISQAEDLISVTLASSQEASDFLRHLDQAVGSMKRTTAKVSQRCVSAIRGPVLWSETVTARASALGNEDIFVCSVLSRSFDSPENRMLVSSVLSLSRAQIALQSLPPDLLQRLSVDQEHIGQVSDLARRWLSDPRLSGIRTQEPSQRERARVMRSRRSNRLQPLFKFRELALNPFAHDPAALDSLVNPQTRKNHAELLQRVEATEAQTGRIQELLCGPNGLQFG